MHTMSVSVCMNVVFWMLLSMLGVDSALIKNLPGLKQSINFKQYSGYVEVDASHHRRLFYWFVESQQSPSNDPLVLWMNGGPGCSSLDGLLAEHGPFRVHSNGKDLEINKYSWNTVANVIYLEAPAGVGFSYSENTSDYTTDDYHVASDNYKFLLGFFQEFPQFKSNPFFISGESYAGHYVPQLAQLVMQNNQKGQLQINLKGVLAGNPNTSPIDGKYYVPFLAGHALTSYDDYENAFRVCDNGNFNAPNRTQQCTNAIASIQAALGRINPYNIYDKCVGKPSVNGYCFTNFNSLSAAPIPPLKQSYVPCLNVTPQTVYLDREDVREALHVDSAAMQWTICSTILNYKFLVWDMIPIYNQLVKQYRVLFFSGDVDSCVPWVCTQKAIDTIEVTGTRGNWTAWSIEDSVQVAGYQLHLGDNLDYLTIKGAGHMVPMYKPAEALSFFHKFITGQSFSS